MNIIQLIIYRLYLFIIKMKRLGIIGGLGPETGCRFLLSVNNKFHELNNCQPDIVLENLPISAKAERNIINGELSREHFNLISKAVKRLNKSKVDFIVIACNTVHVFIDKLRKLSKKPIISIIEETSRECKKLGFFKVGIIGSTKTIKAKLHFNELKKVGIKSISPKIKDQAEISKIIINIIHNQANKKDELFLIKIISKLKSKGAEAVILACTDIPLLISQEKSSILLINTLEILAKSSVELLNKE